MELGGSQRECFGLQSSGRSQAWVSWENDGIKNPKSDAGSSQGSEMSLPEAPRAPEAALGWGGVGLAPCVGQGDLGWDFHRYPLTAAGNIPMGGIRAREGKANSCCLLCWADDCSCPPQCSPRDPAPGVPHGIFPMGSCPDIPSGILPRCSQWDPAPDIPNRILPPTFPTGSCPDIPNGIPLLGSRPLSPLPQPAAPCGARPPAPPSTAPPRTCGCGRAPATAACVSGGTPTAPKYPWNIPNSQSQWQSGRSG